MKKIFNKEKTNLEKEADLGENYSKTNFSKEEITEEQLEKIRKSIGEKKIYKIFLLYSFIAVANLFSSPINIILGTFFALLALCVISLLFRKSLMSLFKIKGIYESYQKCGDLEAMRKEIAPFKRNFNGDARRLSKGLINLKKDEKDINLSIYRTNSILQNYESTLGGLTLLCLTIAVPYVFIKFVIENNKTGCFGIVFGIFLLGVYAFLRKRFWQESETKKLKVKIKIKENIE